MCRSPSATTAWSTSPTSPSDWACRSCTTTSTASGRSGRGRGGKFLQTRGLPRIVLPDLDGNPFAVSSLHGKKVLLVAWASW